uniref:Secreted protein n=1 Tax=Sarcocystis aucheniae TaxID=65407 RepID=A0A5P9S3J6_9APIC|nr:hypothetical protein [Sarcocystis aucheniae]
MLGLVIHYLLLLVVAHPLTYATTSSSAVALAKCLSPPQLLLSAEWTSVVFGSPITSLVVRYCPLSYVDVHLFVSFRRPYATIFDGPADRALFNADIAEERFTVLLKAARRSAGAGYLFLRQTEGAALGPLAPNDAEQLRLPPSFTGEVLPCACSRLPILQKIVGASLRPARFQTSSRMRGGRASTSVPRKRSPSSAAGTSSMSWPLMISFLRISSVLLSR